MSQQNSIQEQIIARAMKEETFRQELLSNPKAAIERELGISIPQGVTIMVYQDTPTTLHLVLPMLPVGAPEGGEELSDAELEQVQGGTIWLTGTFWLNCGSCNCTAKCTGGDPGCTY